MRVKRGLVLVMENTNEVLGDGGGDQISELRNCVRCEEALLLLLLLLLLLEGGPLLGVLWCSIRKVCQGSSRRAWTLQPIPHVRSPEIAIKSIEIYTSQFAGRGLSITAH